MAETLTESIRRQIREAAFCPTCGQPTDDGGLRQLAERIGVPHTVLWRFLRGKDMTGRNLDLLHAWLAANRTASGVA